jgi:hypothetical protein
MSNENYSPDEIRLLDEFAEAAIASGLAWKAPEQELAGRSYSLAAAENAAALSLHWRPLRGYADSRRNEERAQQQGGAS